MPSGEQTSPRAIGIHPRAVYSKARLAAVMGVEMKTITRWAQQPSEELPPPFYLKRAPYWLGAELLRFFERKQARAIEAVAV